MAIGIVVYLVVGGVDLIVFRLPTVERQSQRIAFENQCRSLHPGMMLEQVEAAFNSGKFAFSIEKRGDRVEVRQRSTVCEVILSSGTSAVANVTVKSGAMSWEE